MSGLERGLPPRLRALPPKQQVAAPVDIHAQLLKAQENKHLSHLPASPVPGTVEAIVEMLSTTTNTKSPELMAGVMVTLPVKAQLDMHKAVMKAMVTPPVKAVMKGSPPCAVETAAAADIGPAGTAELRPVGVSPGTGARSGGEVGVSKPPQSRTRLGACATSASASTPGRIERCRSLEVVPADEFWPWWH